MNRSASVFPLIFLLQLLVVGLACGDSLQSGQSLALLTRITTDGSSFSGEFHPVNSRLYLARTAKSIKLYDIETSKVLWTAAGDGYGTRVLPVLFDLTGNRVFVADLRGVFRVLSIETGLELATFNLPVRGALNFASAMKLSVNGEFLYAVDREVVYEFSLADYLLKRRFVTPRAANEIMGLFVTASEVKTLDNNRLTTRNLADQAAEPQPSAYARINVMIPVGHVDRTAATNDGSLIMLNGEHRLSLLDFSGAEVRHCSGFVGFPWSSRSLNNDLIVSVHQESVLRVWNHSTCLVRQELALTDSQFNRVFPFAVRVAHDAATVAVSTKMEILFYKFALPTP